MPNYTNYGNQILTFDYANEASSLSFNKLLFRLIPAGIYDGWELSLDGGGGANDFIIAPGVGFVKTNNAEPQNQLGVRVETQESVTIASTITEATPYVVARLEWNAIENNYLEFTCVTTPQENDIVLGMGLFTGGFLDGGTPFDYTERSYVSKDADTLKLGQGLLSEPTGGTSTNLNGDTYTTAALQTVLNRLRDLSGAGNLAVKRRHVDFGTGALQVSGAQVPIGSEVAMGGSAGTLANSAKLDAALASLATALKNFTGTDNSKVLPAHLKINSTDGLRGSLLPMGSAVDQAISEFTDLAVGATDTIPSAIAALASILSEVGTRIANMQVALDARQVDTGSLADDLMYTTFLPVGAMMMHTGVGWKDILSHPGDTPTLPGWVACTAANHAQNVNVPDLEGKFIRGSNAAGANNQGGSDSVSLTKANVPRHAHTISHGHTGETVKIQTLDGVDTTLSHSHVMSHTHRIWIYNYGGEGNVPREGGSNKVGEGSTRTFIGRTKNTSLEHKHRVEIDDYAGSSEDGSKDGLAGDAFTVVPSHYTMIYIIKIEQIVP